MRTRNSFKCWRCSRWTLNRDWCGSESACCARCFTGRKRMIERLKSLMTVVLVAVVASASMTVLVLFTRPFLK